MKTQLYFLFLISGYLITACVGNRGNSSVCEVKARVEFPEFTKACLLDINRNIMDTLELQKGEVAFTRTDTTQMPYIAFISLINPNDSIDRAEMPLVIEAGKVQVEINEYITTSGTPLNNKLQQFLNELQAASDHISHAGLTREETLTRYSQFYRQQILTNQQNILSDFIFLHYGVHLTDEDKALIKEQLNN